MLSLFMWDMKVEITAGRMHNSLTQFMHFFCKKATFKFIPERITKESSLSFEWTLYSLSYMFGINGGSEFSTVVCRVPKAEGCKVPPPPKKKPLPTKTYLNLSPAVLVFSRHPLLYEEWISSNWSVKNFFQSEDFSINFVFNSEMFSKIKTYACWSDSTFFWSLDQKVRRRVELKVMDHLD